MAETTSTMLCDLMSVQGPVAKSVTTAIVEKMASSIPEYATIHHEANRRSQLPMPGVVLTESVKSMVSASMNVSMGRNSIASRYTKRLENRAMNMDPKFVKTSEAVPHGLTKMTPSI